MSNQLKPTSASNTIREIQADLRELQKSLQRVVNQRNAAWFQLEEAGIDIKEPEEDY